MSELAIETKGLARKFRRNWAVKDLNLHVLAGSVYGLLGPNGAGKSTTIHMLMGLLPPKAGTMRVLGLDPVKQEVPLKRRVGYVAEHHGFYDWMSVDRTIDLVSAYHKTWNRALSDSLKEEFRLDGRSKVKELSKGMRAKLALLLALSFEPELLILDEPTGGLDPAARRSFIESVLGRFQESGKTILVSSHLLNEFAGLLDYVGFMKNGNLQQESPADEIYARYKRARLVFPGGVPEELTVAGSLRCRKNGREALVTFDRFEEERDMKALHDTGAAEVLVEDMNLEDIFVEMAE